MAEDPKTNAPTTAETLERIFSEPVGTDRPEPDAPETPPPSRVLVESAARFFDGFPLHDEVSEDRRTEE